MGMLGFHGQFHSSWSLVKFSITSQMIRRRKTLSRKVNLQSAELCRVITSLIQRNT